jgi:hypothetical protein
VRSIPVFPRSFRVIPGSSGLIPAFSGVIPGFSGLIPGSFRLGFVGAAVGWRFFRFLKGIFYLPSGRFGIALFTPFSNQFTLFRTFFTPFHTISHHSHTTSHFHKLLRVSCFSRFEVVLVLNKRRSGSGTADDTGSSEFSEEFFLSCLSVSKRVGSVSGPYAPAVFFYRRPAWTSVDRAWTAPSAPGFCRRFRRLRCQRSIQHAVHACCCLAGKLKSVLSGLLLSRSAIKEYKVCFLCQVIIRRFRR